MSHIIVIAADMHKIADIIVNVKYRRPGNVIEYMPVDFEIFKEGEYFNAIPLLNLQTKILTNLPNELLFQVKKDIIYNHKQGTEEVVQDIVNELIKMNVVETPQKLFVKTTNTSSSSKSFM